MCLCIRANEQNILSFNVYKCNLLIKFKLQNTHLFWHQHAPDE